MSTFMLNPSNVERKWYIIDAAGKPLGRVAAQAAHILNGKNKPTFTPHVDCGDHVIVINVDKIVLTGNKAQQKFYRHHSGWVGGLKETRYDKLMATKPEFALRLAVRRMLPKNSIGKNSLARLRPCKGTQHNHAAQKPVALES